MPKRKTGDYLITTTAGEEVHAFVPSPLPVRPPLVLDYAHHELIEQANRALGRLDGVTSLLPDTSLFLYFYVRKEALLSSQIEGTQSSFSDLLLYESKEVPGVPLQDVVEVSNYVAAMKHGLQRMRKEGFPLSLRLLKEIHGILLAKGRGQVKMPGQFRRTQNWIGGSRPGNARFVPPPANRVLECMGYLEKFLHNQPQATPTLIKAALAHVQFETIHPFLDGNGRLGRLLITLLLCAEKALAEPMLYLSLYFKTHRDEYYDWLQRVRIEGDWEGWLKFFLHGIAETADQAVDTAKEALKLFDKDRTRIERLGRATANALRLHHLLQRKPLLSLPTAVRQLELTMPTVIAAINHLSRLGIVRELTGKRRGRLFVYDAYLKTLQQGTEPLSR